MKFQGDILIFYDFIQVFVFTSNHHLNGHQLPMITISSIRLYYQETSGVRFFYERWRTSLGAVIGVAVALLHRLFGTQRKPGLKF